MKRYRAEWNSALSCACVVHATNSEVKNILLPIGRRGFPTPAPEGLESPALPVAPPGVFSRRELQLFLEDLKGHLSNWPAIERINAVQANDRRKGQSTSLCLSI